MDFTSEIKSLPNLGYVYFKDSGKPCIVVLGGESCPSSEGYQFWQGISNYNQKLIELYENKPFSQDIKDAIADNMKKMRSACDSRMSGTYTLAQQTAYIDALSPDERQQIEEQVLMYRECYAIYQDSLRQR